MESYKSFQGSLYLDDHLNFTCVNMQVLDKSPEYVAKFNALKSFRYVNTDNIVQLKGQVACSIGKQELILTELLFRHILTDLSEEDIAALLSCLVFNQKTEKEPNLTPSQKGTIDCIQEIARDIGKTQKHCGLQEDVDDYVDQFWPSQGGLRMDDGCAI